MGSRGRPPVKQGHGKPFCDRCFRPNEAELRIASVSAAGIGLLHRRDPMPSPTLLASESAGFVLRP